jgi:two-component system, NarL family, nitrate/nitrite response regulator NarL
VSLRVLIVDDNASFIDAARVLLERQGMGIAGIAMTSSEALRQAHELRPDVVLVDISLGRESGFDLAQRLVECDSRAVVILISTHSESDFADLIAESPATGFLPKLDLSAAAIHRILDGHSR